MQEKHRAGWGCQDVWPNPTTTSRSCTLASDTHVLHPLLESRCFLSHDEECHSSKGWPQSKLDSRRPLKDLAEAQALVSDAV